MRWPLRRMKTAARTASFLGAFIFASPHDSMAGWSQELVGANSLSLTAIDITLFRGSVVAGGDFVWSSEWEPIRGIVQYTNGRWVEIGGGVSNGVPGFWNVKAVVEYQGDLIVGGNFLRAGRVAAHHLARWDGSSWHAMGNADDWVFDLVVVGTDLYVGGRFSTIGGIEAHGIARFDGHNWFPVGSGPGLVIEMLFLGDHIIAAGSFEDADGRYGVAMWDGATWTRMGDRTFGPDGASCLQMFEGAIIAGGSFLHQSTRLPYSIGRWTGSRWVPVGELQGSAIALAVFRGDLLAGATGAADRSQLYKWDGSTWQAFTQGINGPVTALLPMGNSLLVAGSFTANEYVPCNAVARWDEPPTPIAVEDLSALPDPLGGVRISCRLAAATLVDMERIMVQRAPAEAGPFETISPGLLAGPDHGLTYWDRDGSPNRPAWYRFAVEHGSAVDFTRAVRVVDRVLLKDFGLRVVASSAGVEVRYRLPNDSSAHAVAVYDVAGRVVRMLASGVAGAGDHVALWNRTTTSGSPTARGVYFVRLESNGQHASARIVQPIR